MIFTLVSFDYFNHGVFTPATLTICIILGIILDTTYNFYKLNERKKIATHLLAKNILQNEILKINNEKLNTIIDRQEDRLKIHSGQLNKMKIELDYYKNKSNELKIDYKYWKRKYNKKPISITPYAMSLIDKTNLTGTCPICLEDLETKHITVTRCGHILHEECLEIYLSGKTVLDCPVCRT